MTLKEAKSGGIRPVRKPFWNDRATLELPLQIAGGFGTWYTLLDPCVQDDEIPLLWLDVESGETDDWIAVDSQPPTTAQ